MELDLLYGRGTLAVRLPDDLEVTVIRKPAMPVLAAAGEAVAVALATPVSARPLREEARGKASACVLICDITRPVPNRLLLGPVVRQLLEAVRFVERYAIVRVPRRFSTVVTSAAGYPLDKTCYQTVKGMVAPKDILAPGADLIIASGCSEGMGSREYLQAQERLVALGPDAFLAGIAEKRFTDVDEWQTQMQVKPRRLARVHLFTRGLSPGDRALTGVRLIDSVGQAVAASVRASGDRAVAFIPEGPYLLPVCA